MDGTVLDFKPAEPGQTLWDVYNSGFVPKHLPVICMDMETRQPILRRDWGREVTTCHPAFYTLPAGGGGGGFKDILRVVAILAVAIAAPYAAPAIGLAIGVTSTVGVAAITGGLIAVGTFLINAILPAAAPKQPGTGAEASPTYSTTAQGNRARLFETVPVGYGQHLIYPDWVTTPFASYVNNQQQIYQLLNCGLGEYEPGKVRIGEVEVWNSDVGYTGAISGIELAFIPPGQPVTLFPGLVYSSPLVGGQALRKVNSTGKYLFANGPAKVTGVGSGGPDDDAPNFNGFLIGDSVVVTGSGANNGTYTITATAGGSNVEWIQVSGAWPSTGTLSGKTFDVSADVGPFPCTPSGTISYKLAFDIIWPQGLGVANDDGGLDNDSTSWTVSYRPIDNAGAPLGPYVDHNESRDSSSASPLRLTLEYDVTPARYEAKIRRTSTDHGDTKHLDDMQWGGMRGFIPDDNIYPDVTLLAVKFNVGDQLTSASTRQVNVIQTRKLPTWTGSAWTAPVATRSIAWAACDIVRNQVYGAQLPDSQIDIAAAAALEVTWAARGDTLDGVYDTKQTIWDALSAALRVGRAFPLLIGSTVSFGRDEPKMLNTAVITPRTMMKESFSTDHILFDESSPDDVIIEYLDEETWKQDEVQAKLAGSLSESPARVKLFGCVNRERAWRYGMYQAASNAYRRVLAQATTELAGRLLLRGKAVLVSHDLPQWGQSGDIWERLSPTELQLSEPVDWGQPLQYYMGLRLPGDGLWGPVKVSQGAGADVALMDTVSFAAIEAAQGTLDSILITDDDDKGRVKTVFVIGAGETTYARRFLVSTTRPNGMENIDVVLQNYDERVYTAEEDGTVPDRSTPTGPGQIPAKPVIAGLLVSQDPNAAGNVVSLFASWAPAAGADTYIAELSYDNLTWIQVYSGAASQFQFQANAGLSYLRVAGLGSLRGDFVVKFGTYGNPTSVPAVVTGLALTINPGGTLSMSWLAASRATSYNTQVYIESTPGSGIYDTLKTSKIVTGLSTAYGSAEIAAAGGPFTRVMARVYGINAIGNGAADTDIQALTAPAFPVILTASGYITDTTPLINGTAIAGATVHVYVDGVLKVDATASPFGAWSAVLPALATGIRLVTATQTTAGGTSAATPTPCTLGVNYPPVPVFTTVTGSTYDHTPTIVGTAVAGATVQVYADAVLKATTTADGSGNWSVATSTLANGARAITARQTVSGVQGPANTAITITILALDADTITLLAAMTVEPTSARMGLYNDLITSLKTAGVWTKLDCLYWLGAHDAQAARLNIKAPANFALTATGSPTYTVDRGYTGTGVGSSAGGYLTSTFTPSTAAGQWTLNSAHLGVWNRVAASTALSLTSAEIGVAGAFIYTKDAVANNIRTALNDGSVSNTAAGAPTGVGHFCLSRTSSTVCAKYHDSVAQTASAITSTSLPASTVSVLRANASSHSDAQVLAAHWGASLSAVEEAALYTALNTFKTAIGA